MKVVNGKIGKIIVGSPSATVIFDVPTYQAKWLNELDTDKEYKLEIKEVKSRKSLQQNNFAWALMTEISRKLDILPDPEDVYMKVIQLAKIQIHQIAIPIEAKKALLKAFRCMVLKHTYTNEKGVEMGEYECYYGMSKFDKEEMSRFIDSLLYFAEQYGVDTTEYEGYL